jgi:hypothetical protein
MRPKNTYKQKQHKETCTIQTQDNSIQLFIIYKDNKNNDFMLD